MAFVVRRPQGRWEIRESFVTPAGPRARTLASFTALTPDVLDRAEEAARTRLDRDALIRAAKRAGAPIRRSHADALAESLIRRLAHGERLRPGLSRLLVDALGEAPTPARSIDDAVVDWIGASAEERGAGLLDLLGLADSLPNRRRGPLTFPGLSRERLRA
jgi:hypothetical protein